MATAETPENLPVLYFGHGAPPLADDELWTSQFAAWSAELPRPKAILVMSAHWESAPLAIGATTTSPWSTTSGASPSATTRSPTPPPERPARRIGPRAAQRLRHPCAEAPDSRPRPRRVRAAERDVPRGRRAGAADLHADSRPASGCSPSGRRLAPLRDEGVLIMGSGFLTHNLSCVDMSRGPDDAPPSWSAEFDDWAAEAVPPGTSTPCWIRRPRRQPPRSPTRAREHLAPLFVALGASSGTHRNRPQRHRRLLVRAIQTRVPVRLTLHTRRPLPGCASGRRFTPPRPGPRPAAAPSPGRGGPAG